MEDVETAAVAAVAVEAQETMVAVATQEVIAVVAAPIQETAVYHGGRRESGRFMRTAGKQGAEKAMQMVIGSDIRRDTRSGIRRDIVPVIAQPEVRVALTALPAADV